MKIANKNDIAEAYQLLLIQIKQAKAGRDPEMDHIDADDALLAFIAVVTGEDVAKVLFDDVAKWYA